jgi:hypothetical protein
LCPLERERPAAAAAGANLCSAEGYRRVAGGNGVCHAVGDTERDSDY